MPVPTKLKSAQSIVGGGADLRWFFGNLVHVKLRRAHTGGAYVLSEHWGGLGDTPPLHLHRVDDETFHVLEGTVELLVEGGDVVRLGPGDTALAPKGIAHTYRVISPEGAKWLLITSPGDFEGFLDEVSAPAPSAAVPPAPDGPPDVEEVERLMAAAARHGIEILGPPGTLPAGHV